MNGKRLTGKVAVITGAASGMGLAMANRFANEGATVVMGDWNGGRLNDAVNSIISRGGAAVGLQGNIAEQQAAEALVDLAIDKYGKLDVLCNNAGIADYMQGVAELDNDIWRKVMSINLEACMYTSRRALQHMLVNNGGSIINISSVAGIHGGIAGAAYTTAKHGLIGLTKNTAWMYAKKNVRCNAICPGATVTNIKESMPDDKTDQAGLQRTAEVMALSPAYLDADEIASLALFLASDESKKINGAVVTADGGWDAA